MSLIEHTLFGVHNRVDIAIARLREFCKNQDIHVSFSGGKDSVVVEHLCRMADVKLISKSYEVSISITTVDPPELMQFVREYYPDINYVRPEKSMRQIISEKGFPPTRQIRYCCEVLKEHTYDSGAIIVTGVRAQESKRRSNRKLFEACNKKKGKFYLHPIIDWSEKDVWDYIKENNLPYCSLYDEGWKRLGCIMCPKTGSAQIKKEMDRWPAIANVYRKACIQAKGNEVDGMKMFEWWIAQRPSKDDKETCDMFT